MKLVKIYIAVTFVVDILALAYNSPKGSHTVTLNFLQS